MSQKKYFTRLFVSSLCVLLVALILTGGVNFGLDYYRNSSGAVVRVRNEMSQKKADILSLTAEALKDAEGESAQAAQKYYEALALKEKLVAEENFYKHYKNRKDYHYYGKFFELFNDVHGADTLIIGSSRAVYGVNPAILEKNSDLDGYSFYNYAFNGARPSYFEKWYNILKTEANYPIPKTVIYCVDWFMFDPSWMWRDMEGTDAANGGALYELRLYMKNNPKPEDPKVTDPFVPEDTSAVTEDDKTEDNSGKKEKTTLLGWANKLWNGELKGIEELGKKLTGKLSLFSSRDKIPQMVSYVFSGKGASDNKAAREERQTLQAELDVLYADYERILSGEGVTKEYPEVTLPKYNHSFTVDYDGNITSSYYKGWLPWEFNYAGNSEGTGAEFQESAPQTVSYAPGNIPAQEQMAFRRLITALKRDGVNVIFVHLPDYNGGGVASRDEASIINHTKYIEDFAKKNGIPFINYDTTANPRGESIANHKNYYSNWNHLNEKGAAAFSKLLAEDLAALLKKS